MSVAHCDWRELAQASASGVDALVTDVPYSERCHRGHDALKPTIEGSRRKMEYAHWSSLQVHDFVATWAPLVRGWMVSITDHALARDWEEAMLAADRYVFAPVVAVITGSRVRLAGDGPTCDTLHVIVSRPKTAPYSRWGALPGHYKGSRETQVRIGGKPVWLMSALVRDYTRPGDLVCDPCCGAGTTGVAARMHGRRFVGCDIDEKTADFARKRIERTREQIALPLGIERTREQETGT